MKTYKNKWMEFSTGFGFKLQYHVASYFDQRPMIAICLLWGSFYIHLPFNTGIEECETPTYGLYWHESGLWLNFGKKVKVIWMPWSFDWYRSSYLLNNGVWDHEYRLLRKEYWREENKGLLWSETHPYIYTLKNGIQQNRIATIRLEEREWRRRIFMWIPLFNLVRRTISIDFDDEVGERTGSWKGGTIGCGWDIKKDELPVHALRRMEKERKFN